MAVGGSSHAGVCAEASQYATRVEVIGDATLMLGDCREILPTLAGPFDAVVTDPPYGIRADAAMHKAGGTKHGVALAAKRHYAATDWDSEPLDAATLRQLRELSRWQIIFGGNYFDVPPARCWLVWDKQVNGEFADCELAWTNLDKPVRRITWMWNGMLRKGQEERFDHPTQKPLGVMEWCINQLPADAVLIFDPFMGSGTTGVACARLGRRFIGIEREPAYFDTACRRIEESYRQPRLFDEPPPKPRQGSIFDGEAA